MVNGKWSLFTHINSDYAKLLMCLQNLYKVIHTKKYLIHDI